MLKRQIFGQLWQNIETDKIILLNGARQTGKTTLLRMIQEKLIKEKNVSPEQMHFFDLEKSEDLAIWSKQSVALEVLPKNGEKQYLFIDEFQKSDAIGSILKVIHDHYPQIKVIVTGSASWYLDIDESMAGRKKVINIYPLSFQEYINWKTSENIQKLYLAEKLEIFTGEIIDLINEHLIDFISYGGYPEVVLEKDKVAKSSLLSELTDSYILKDIQIWNYAANTLEVKKLLTILASQTGSLLSLNSLSLNSRLRRNILSNRLELLQKTFILKLNQPYFTNKLKEIIKSPKVYLVDNGLRNSLLNNFSIISGTSDFGYNAENFAAMELLKNSDASDEIYFWRTKAGQEVDFIIKRENSLVPIEVKSGNEENIPEGLKSFIRRYHPQKAFVLNWSTVKDLKYKDCAVYFRPLWFADRIQGFIKE